MSRWWWAVTIFGHRENRLARHKGDHGLGGRNSRTHVEIDARIKAGSGRASFLYYRRVDSSGDIPLGAAGQAESCTPKDVQPQRGLHCLRHSWTLHLACEWNENYRHTSGRHRRTTLPPDATPTRPKSITPPTNSMKPYFLQCVLADLAGRHGGYSNGPNLRAHSLPSAELLQLIGLYY